ncbi:MAG: EcsC family protein [Chloroflexi bacterium]|nr:EcsC family protein [Chloroflexota bacterium]OJW02672.1 MAG: hypothetical protein BGO39_05380 [Chloroflexi bacterium 54-19]
MTASENKEQVFYLWECPKCGIANQTDLIFCPNCAFNEGLAEPAPNSPEKISKIAEALGSAIDWSLKHGQHKPADVLAQAAKRHRDLHDLPDLRRLPPAALGRLADSYLNFNRLGATGTGLTAGLPGGLAAFATIPADISALVYFSLHCLSGISQSYSLETASETGQTIELLAFAYASKFETLVIGQRRLENIDLAAYLLQKPEQTRLVKGCLLKQLSSYLTVDFAKTSWATFLPVVGGVVNGVDNFWFLGEVGKRGKQFYRTLLPLLPVPPAPPRSISPAIPAPVTLEVREERLEVSGQIFNLYLVSPVGDAQATWVVVLGEKPLAENFAEKLGLVGVGAVALDGAIGAEGFKEVWGALPGFLENFGGEGIEGLNLLGLGNGSSLALEVLPDLAPQPHGVVIYDPAPLVAPLKIEVPVLVQLGGEASAQDTTWLNHLQPSGKSGLISINTFDGSFADLARARTAESPRSGLDWSWKDALEWFRRPG